MISQFLADQTYDPMIRDDIARDVFARFDPCDPLGPRGRVAILCSSRDEARLMRARLNQLLRTRILFNEWHYVATSNVADEPLVTYVWIATHTSETLIASYSVNCAAMLPRLLATEPSCRLAHLQYGRAGEDPRRPAVFVRSVMDDLRAWERGETVFVW